MRLEYKNLVSHDRGKTFKVIMETLSELGYWTTWRVIDGQAFVPQHRERTLIIGFSKNVGFAWPKLPGEKHCLTEILHHTGDLLHGDCGRYTGYTGAPLPKYTLSDHLQEYLQAYKDKHRAAENGFGFSLFGGKDVSHTVGKAS